MPEPITLASRSPQRRAILEQLGVEFTVEAAHVEEATRGEPRAIVVENALAKARAVAAGDGAARVLGVDTVVVLDGRVFGKPADREEAETFLRRLSGRTHEVWSGVALVGPEGAERSSSSRGSDSDASRRPTSIGTSTARSGATEPADTPSRAAVRPSSRESRATSGTSSGCRCRSSSRWPRNWRVRPAEQAFRDACNTHRAWESSQMRSLHSPLPSRAWHGPRAGSRLRGRRPTA